MTQANAVRVTPDALVAEARTWLGTPFHWQASVKGVGADCKGFIWGVARALELPEAASLYAAMADYGARVPVALLRRGLAETLQAVSASAPGDLLLLKVAGRAQHLALHADAGVLLHTYSVGPRKVIATPIAAALRAWPLDSAWRFASLQRPET